MCDFRDHVLSGFRKGRRLVSGLMAGVLCFSMVPFASASAADVKNADVKGIPVEDSDAFLKETGAVPLFAFGGADDGDGSTSSHAGEGYANLLRTGIYGWTFPRMSNKSGVYIGGGAVGRVKGSHAWPGTAHVIVESKPTMDSAVKTRLDESRTWPGTATANQVIVPFTWGHWDPQLPASSFTKPVINVDQARLVDGETFTYANSGHTGIANVYTRLRYTYDTDDGKTHQSGVAMGSATDADGWTSTELFDSLTEQYSVIDDNPDNFEVTASTPNATNHTDSLLAPDNTLSGKYVISGTGSISDDYETVNMEVTEYSTCDIGVYSMVPLTADFSTRFAGMYIHQTLKTLSGNVTSVVTQIPPAYQIHYDSQGGSAVESSRKIFTGYERQVTNVEPKRDGYIFKGWYDQPNAGGNKFEAGNSIRLTSDVTLYAAWEQSFSITTEVVGGTIDPSISNLKAGASKVITYRPADVDYKLVSIEVDGRQLTTEELAANQSRYAFNDIQEDHTIRVVYEQDVPKEYQITTSIDHGTIDPSQSQIEEGTDVTIEYTPDDGYYVDSILVDGQEVDIEAYPDAYPFEEIDSNHTISVVCKKYLKVETSVEGGTITPTDDTLKEGDSKTVTYSPNEGYHLESVTVDGSAVDIKDYPTSYPFEDIDSDHVIRVVFVKDPEPEETTYSVETSIEHGTITDSRTDIPEGTDVAVDFRPDEGYYVDRILVDGEEIPNTGQLSHMFPDINADHEITVTCSPYFSIRTEVVNGVITESMDDVKAGDSRTITYRPTGGCVLDYIEVDGERVSIEEFSSQYTFRDVQGNHTIRVVYAAEDTYTVSTSVENGTITETVSDVKKGEDVTIMFSPNEGFVLSAIIIDGKRMDDAQMKELYGDGGANQSYVFEGVSANHAIQVVYSEPVIAPAGDAYIEIWKTIEDIDAVVYAKGMPTFSFRIDGYDKDGKRHTFYRTLVFEEGKQSAHVRLKVPRGGYHVTELPSDGFALSGTPATLTAQVPEGSEETVVRVDFVNKADSYEDYTGNHHVVNELK